MTFSALTARGKRVNDMTQCERILDHLKTQGPITQRQAYELFGCERLGARIFDLREKGYAITRTMITAPNRFGDITRFAQYALEKGVDV